MERTGADVLIDALKAEGVKTLFGVSGSSILSIMDVLYRTPEINYIQSQHEEAAMFMADGFARASHDVGVCLVSAGAGATNALTPTAHAYYNSTPTILISGEESARTRFVGLSEHHPLESEKVFGSVTKLARYIDRIEFIPRAVNQAFTTALSGRQGSVYLGIPRDILLAKADVATPLRKSFRPTATRGNPHETEAAVKLLMKAKRPVALAGGGVNCADANNEMVALAELLAMPVGTTVGHKGTIPEDHPLALGLIGGGSTPPAREAFKEADVILAVGCTFNAATTRGFGHNVIPATAKIIQIDIDAREIGKIYPVAVGVVGDAKLVLSDIIGLVKESTTAASRRKNNTERMRELSERKAAWEKKARPQKNSNAVPIKTFRLLSDLRKALPKDAVVGGASGSSGGWFNFAFQALEPERIGGQQGWHPLGGDYCETLGVKVALPDKVVACFIGDGSMMMCLQELVTAAANDIRAIAVVQHNGIFGNMHAEQVREFGGRFMGTNIPVPNLANIARDMGNYGERVVSPKDIIPAVKRAIDSKKPALLEIMVDPSFENLSPNIRD